MSRTDTRTRHLGLSAHSFSVTYAQKFEDSFVCIMYDLVFEIN